MKLKSIKIINFNYNEVEITPKWNKSVEELYLNNNKIKQISPSSYTLQNLNTLEIDNNPFYGNMNLINMQNILRVWIEKLGTFKCSCIYEEIRKPSSSKH